MLVWSTIEVGCPMCGQRLRVRELGGGFITGQDSDLLMRMQGKHVIQAEINTCSACRYSGFAFDFLERKISDPMVERYFREFVEKLEPESQDLDSNAEPARTPLPHLQYYWSAQLAPLLGLTPKEIGTRMLRAYWCLRLEPSSRLPNDQLDQLDQLYLRQSIAYLRKALRHEKDPTLVYLVAELCRRNGSFVRSKNYFDRLLDSVTHTSQARPATGGNCHEYLIRAAEKLHEAARREDSTAKTMEELLYPVSEGRAGKGRAAEGRAAEGTAPETSDDDSPGRAGTKKNETPKTDKSRKSDGSQ